jgi:hypothetical protein
VDQIRKAGMVALTSTARSTSMAATVFAGLATKLMRRPSR